MKPKRIFFALAIMAVSWFISATAEAGQRYPINEKNVIKGDFHVRPGERVSRSILITSGTAFIEGTLEGSCIADGGDIMVTGRVEGSAVSFGKDRTITVTGTVKQDVSAYKGHIIISGNVGGNINALESSLSIAVPAEIHNIRTFNTVPEIKPGFKLNANAIEPLTVAQFAKFIPSYSTYKAASGSKSLEEGIALATGVGLILLLPVFFLLSKMESTVLTMENDFWKSFGLGLLALLPAVALILLFTMKNRFGEIAVCLALPVATGLLFGLVVGGSAFCRMMGNKLAALAGKGRPEPFTAIILGYLPLAVLGLCTNHWSITSRDLLDSALTLVSMAGYFTLLLGTVLGMGALLRSSPNPFRKE